LQLEPGQAHPKSIAEPEAYHDADCAIHCDAEPKAYRDAKRKAYRDADGHAEPKSDS
jgi:hypothetical protein